MADFTPAEVFPPGEFIREELGERGWTQSDLAEIMGRPLPAVNQIIKGRRAITPETARELAAAFDTSAELWLNLESSYRLSLTTTAGGEIRKRARAYEAAPVKEMQRRGWIRPQTTAESLEEELCRFYHTESLSAIPPPIKMAARASADTSDAVRASRLAWGHRVTQLANMVHADAYTPQGLIRLLPELHRIEANPEEIRKIPRLLAEGGIRFLIVEHLQHTRLDGAAIWVNDKPVIALSMRFDRIDWFWHTLIHELMHVRRKDESCLDADLEASPGDDQVESRADREAAEFLIPGKELDSFILRTKPYFSKVRIVQFANRIRVHPGIVVGQLHHRFRNYHANREMLVGVRDLLVGVAFTDGWGQKIEVN